MAHFSSGEHAGGSSDALPPLHHLVDDEEGDYTAVHSGGEGDGDEVAGAGAGELGLAAALEEAQSKRTPSDEGQENDKTGEKKKPHKKRNRKPSSCLQCRRKKLRCDRQSPCGSCVLRGEANQCSWEDAVPLLLGRADNDASELKAQVDRLQGLVDYLTRAPNSALHGYPAFPAPPSYATPSDATSDPSVGLSPQHFYPTSRTGPHPPATAFLPAVARSHDGPLNASVVSAFEHSEVPSREGSDQGVAARETRHDLKGADLAEALSHLAISHLSSGGPGPVAQRAPDGPISLDEARTFINLPAHFGLSEAFEDHPTDSSAVKRYQMSEGTTQKLSTLPFAPPPEGGIASIISQMPTDAQATSALQYYVRYVDWYLHPIHLPCFQKQWSDMRTKPPQAADPFFVATFLAVVGIGVAMMPAARALRDGFGGPKQRDALADKFLHGAMSALTLGKFLDKPSVEAIRAILIINTFFVFMDAGEQTGSGMGLLSLAVQIALQLGLHRDPDKSPGQFDPMQTEDRRRLFWTLCSFECLASSALGRSYSIFNLDNVDCKFPRDLDDEEITYDGIRRRSDLSRETVMTSLIIRMKIGVVAKRISDKAFGIKSVSYATVMELNRELKKQETDLPPQYQLRYDEATGTFALPAAGSHVTSLRFYMIHISLQQEYLRLHRPFLVKATTAAETEQSRRICVRAARIILAIQRQPACQQNWGGLLYKSISAAICLALDLLQEPYGQYSDLYRAEIQAILVTLRRYAPSSSLCRKGSKVLHFLLEREGAARASHRERGPKRSRHSIAATPTQPAQVFSMAPPAQRAPSPGLMRHKPAAASRAVQQRPSAQPYGSASSDEHASWRHTIDNTGSKLTSAVNFEHSSPGSQHDLGGLRQIASGIVEAPHTSHDSVPASSLPLGYVDPMLSLPVPVRPSATLPAEYAFDFAMLGEASAANLSRGSSLPAAVALSDYAPKPCSGALAGYGGYTAGGGPPAAMASGSGTTPARGMGTVLEPGPFAASGVTQPSELQEWKDLQAYGLPNELEWQGVLGQGVLGSWP